MGPLSGKLVTVGSGGGQKGIIRDRVPMATLDERAGLSPSCGATGVVSI